MTLRLQCKHHIVLTSNILIIIHLVHCQICDIPYNMTLDNSHLNQYAQCCLFSSYVCSVATMKISTRN